MYLVNFRNNPVKAVEALYEMSSNPRVRRVYEANLQRIKRKVAIQCRD